MKYNDIEHPLVVQLRGSNPERMAKAAVLAASLGYDEVNINCGCPARKCKCDEPFGAVLMKDPKKVQELVQEMIKSSPIPVTVKCRIGVDDIDSFDSFRNFISTVIIGGVTHFIIHARKALLDGLDPSANRTIPPLKYDWVYAIAKQFPTIKFDLNGGLKTIEEVKVLLNIDKNCFEGREWT